ncbi:MAG TPA: glycosyltransferase family 2 protein [Terriglobia bacterium]|nr:glycosyltransferase family 2 protein [Terriglobia bacterium]
MISVIIPTYNEAAVIEETLRRAAAALRSAGEAFELVVVDDASADGTADRVESLAHEIPARVLRRPGRLGLATAVLDGWAMARGDVWGVMDADLQHPPETLTALAAAIRQGADLAIGSRYVPGGGTSDWTWMRRFISRTATHMAATVLPLKLAAVGDPMSGMFMIRASALRDAHLNPLGYKILLEVIAKARYKNLVEVPYIFQERERGASKLGARQYVEYLQHLARLAVRSGQLFAWMRYGSVALVGAIIDVGLFCTLVERAQWRAAVALPVAIEAALLSNFVCNETFTFRSGEAPPFGPGGWRRLARYERICIPGAVLNFLVTLLCIAWGARTLSAAAIGVVAGGALNLLMNIPAIWRAWASHPPAGASAARV